MDLKNEKVYEQDIGERVKTKRHFLSSFNEFLNKHNSNLIFAVCVFLLSMLWCVFVLFANKFAIMFGWDYSSQYITFYYGYWDIWRQFFKTGEFVLVDFSTYLGVDNIGSNAYYGLFDPFVIALTLFPRDWIPQTFTIMTMLKIVTSSLCMKAYLNYMGVKDGTSKFGAIAYAFSGYMNFMVGFCSFVSVVIYVPLLMLGVEKVVRERKITVLVWSIFLIGITSFFFLVVLCIWGVMYALWRFFQTVSERTIKENCSVMGLGVMSFALGLMVCSFVVIPSLRQSALSGRTSSIGSLYLEALINSLSDGTFFTYLFEQVGGSPGREIMPLVSFFYPTGGYLYLPMMIPSYSYKYDAWVASIFCYTPFIILFFQGILNSIRKKKYSHLVAIVICLYFLFTDFAYFAFFAFTGNGYGRWFLVLIPAIIYYGCKAFDEVEECPKYFPIISGFLAIFGTIGTYLLMRLVLEGKTFVNPNGYTYFRGEGYLLPGEYTASYNGYKYSTIFTLLYEVLFVLIEGSAFAVFARKKWFRKFFIGALTLEVIIMGNMNYVFCGYWNLTKSYNGGTNNLNDSVLLADFINNQDDDTMYRCYFDSANREKNFSNAIGVNGSSCFHSLLNFEVYDYTIMMKMANTPSSGTSYNGTWSNPSWSGQYVQKRFATDMKQGYKYYVIKNGGYPNWESENVPFNSELIGKYTNPTTGQIYRIYRNNDAVALGYAVDSDKLYYLGSPNNDHKHMSFYDGSINTLRMAEDVMLDGAIFQDDTIIEGFNIKAAEGLTAPGKELVNKTGYKINYYETSNGDLYLANKNSGYRDEGPIYFMNHYTPSAKTAAFTYTRDYGKIVLYPASGFGDYFNDDIRGCYFNMEINVNKGNEPRVYMFGDTFDENGNLVSTNALLNFEYRSLYNYDTSGIRCNGLYAKGRVKYICFCAPSGAGKLTFNLPKFYMQEYGEIAAKTQRIKENELQNVKKINSNSFSATSNYSEPKVVVTQLAYDDSWNVYANDKPLETYKVDGGFLGFVAPEGDTTYRVEYKTKYLTLGVFLFMGGTGVYFTYMLYDFLKTAKKKREESPSLNVSR